MTTHQPEALRLAENLELWPVAHVSNRSLSAADELRRLHVVEKQRDDLLAALREIDSWLVCACIATPEDMAQSFSHMEQVASAAIAKAERTTP